MYSKCPYCGEELISGYIYGSHYYLKWLPETKDLVLGMIAVGSEKIGTFVERPRVKGHKCSKCNKIIVDLNEE